MDPDLRTPFLEVRQKNVKIIQSYLVVIHLFSCSMPAETNTHPSLSVAPEVLERGQEKAVGNLGNGS